MSSHINIIDHHSMFNSMKEKEIRSKPNFPKLLQALADVRIELGWPQAEKTIGFVCFDPLSAAQGRFAEALVESGISPELVDYRHDGVNTAMAYTMGLVAYRNPTILLVSNSLSLVRPLEDLVSRNVKVAVGYFPNLRHHEWLGDYPMFNLPYEEIFEIKAKRCSLGALKDI